LGDRVEVQVKSVDYYRQQIDLVAVGGGSEAGDEDGDEPIPEPYLALPDDDLDAEFDESADHGEPDNIFVEDYD
jgi:ribonuclease R